MVKNSVMRAIIMLSVVFLLLSQSAFSQRGGEGGLIIESISYNTHGIVKDGEGLKIYATNQKVDFRHVLLNKNGKPTKEELPFFEVKNFDVYCLRHCLIYLPPLIEKGNRIQSTPYHRLEFIVDKDTMKIDFIGILQWNADGFYERLGHINFKAGYYKSYRKNATLSKEKRKTTTNYYWQDIVYALESGINVETDEILYKNELLYYRPPIKKNQVTNTETDSVTRLSLTTINKDSVALTVNGWVTANGNCPTTMMLCFQEKRYDVWTDFYAYWIIYNCDSTCIYKDNEVLKFNIYDLKLPYRQLPFPVGEYRFFIKDCNGNPYYSESFLIQEKDPGKIKYEELNVGGAPNSYHLKDSTTFIEARALPITHGEEQTYHFIYYHLDESADTLRAIGEIGLDEWYYAEFKYRLPRNNVVLNRKNYTGKIKIAFNTVVLKQNQKYTKTDLYILEYVNGKLVGEVKILEDVDLKTEKQIQR